jgi:hypothetical protein
VISESALFLCTASVTLDPGTLDFILAVGSEVKKSSDTTNRYKDIEKGSHGTRLRHWQKHGKAEISFEFYFCLSSETGEQVEWWTVGSRPTQSASPSNDGIIALHWNRLKMPCQPRDVSGGIVRGQQWNKEECHCNDKGWRAGSKCRYFLCALKSSLVWWIS